MVWGAWPVSSAPTMKVWSSRTEKSGWTRNTDGYTDTAMSWRAGPESSEVLGLNPVTSNVPATRTTPPSRTSTFWRPGSAASSPPSRRATTATTTTGVARRSPAEPQAVGDRGRLPATGHPELGQDAGHVQAGGLGGDEQRLADLAVGVAGGHQLEHLGLPSGEAERGELGGRRRGRRGRRVLQPEAAAPGEQLDLASQRAGPQRDRRPVGGPEHRLRLPEAGVGGPIPQIEPLPVLGRLLPPPRVRPSLQPGPFGLSLGRVP